MPLSFRYHQFYMQQTQKNIIILLFVHKKCFFVLFSIDKNEYQFV